MRGFSRLPGEEKKGQQRGISTVNESARYVGDRGANVSAERTGASLSAHRRGEVQKRGAWGVKTPTTITAVPIPPDQVIERDVTIAGHLTSGGGAAMVAVPIVLYNTDDPRHKVRTATTSTDSSGRYQFTLTDNVASTHAYRVCAEGRSAYSRAESSEVLVRYHVLRLRDITRARLAPVARTTVVFNLVWSELLAIFLILAGEGLLFAGYRVAGVGVQAANIVVIMLAIEVLNGERVELLEVLALVSLLRVVNLSFALVPTVTLYWLVVIYGVMFLPIISVVAHRKLSRHDLGLTGGHRLRYLIPFGTLDRRRAGAYRAPDSRKSRPHPLILACLACRAQRRDDLRRDARGRAALSSPAATRACGTQRADCRHTHHKRHLWCDAIRLRQLLRAALRIRSGARLWRRILQDKEPAVCYHDARGEQHTPVRRAPLFAYVNRATLNALA